MARPVHLLIRRPDMPAPVIACGKAVSGSGLFARYLTEDPEKAACFGCAQSEAPLTETQRQIIWDRKCEAYVDPPTSPWEVAKNKAARAAKKAEKIAAKAARAAKRVTKAA